MKHLRLALVFAVLVLSLAALWITDYMMGIHAPIQAAASVKEGILADICGGGDAEEGGGCEDVITSKDGYVPIPWKFTVTQQIKNKQGKAVSETVARWGWMNVPVAQLGQCYYIFLLVWFTFTGIPRHASGRWHFFPMVLSIIAVLATCYYIYVMAFKMEQWCPLCVLLHLIDFLMCGLVVALWPRAKKAESPVKTKREQESVETTGAPLASRHIYATLAVVLALVSMSFLHRYDQLITKQQEKATTTAKKQYTKIEGNIAFLVNAFRGTPRANIPARDTASTLGNASAPYEMVLFSDLQCPSCKRFETWFKGQIMGEWSGLIKVTFRHFPLCTSCNPSQKKTERRPLGLHPQACEAAYAAEAARRLGGTAAFWEMHDLILQNQQGMRSKDFSFEPLAVQVGLDADRFRAEYAGSAVRQAVAQDIQAGMALKLHGTPTVFLNGRRLAAVQRGSRAFWRQLAAAAREQEQTPDKGTSAPPSG